MATKLSLLLLLAFFAIIPLWSQVTPPVKKDTIKTDKNQMYKNLENYSKRKKFTKFIHKLIFKPVKQQPSAQSRKKEKVRTPEMTNSFRSFEGKIVRKINIETLDPFGYSINDTTKKANDWVNLPSGTSLVLVMNFVTSSIKNSKLAKQTISQDTPSPI